MTDKIRIVGSFAEDIVEKVQAFIADLEGVQHVEVLKSGVDVFPQSDAAPAAADEPEPVA